MKTKLLTFREALYDSTKVSHSRKLSLPEYSEPIAIQPPPTTSRNWRNQEINKLTVRSPSFSNRGTMKTPIETLRENSQESERRNMLFNRVLSVKNIHANKPQAFLSYDIQVVRRRSLNGWTNKHKSTSQQGKRGGPIVKKRVVVTRETKRSYESLPVVDVERNSEREKPQQTVQSVVQEEVENNEENGEEDRKTDAGEEKVKDLGMLVKKRYENLMLSTANNSSYMATLPLKSPQESTLNIKDMLTPISKTLATPNNNELQKSAMLGSLITYRNNDTNTHLQKSGGSGPVKKIVFKKTLNFTSRKASIETSDFAASGVNTPRILNFERKKLVLDAMTPNMSQVSFNLRDVSGAPFINLAHSECESPYFPSRTRTPSIQDSIITKIMSTPRSGHARTKSFQKSAFNKVRFEEFAMTPRSPYKRGSRTGTHLGDQSPWRKKKMSISPDKTPVAVREKKRKEIHEFVNGKSYEIGQQSVYKDSFKTPRKMDMIPQETKEVKEEIKKVEDYFAHYNEAKKNQKKEYTEHFYETFRSEQRRLNAYDISLIQQEFTKREGNGVVNYDKVDRIVKDLKFFTTLSRQIRIKLLRTASMASYNAGDIVFRQGEYGDLVYIILRGAVNVKISRMTPYGTTEDVIVTTLYDGNQFGEYSMMGTAAQKKKRSSTQIESLRMSKTIDLETGVDSSLDSPRHQSGGHVTPLSRSDPMTKRSSRSSSVVQFKERSKRSATVEVSETCDLLAIPRRDYQEILMNLIQRELDHKLKSILALHFLSSLDPFVLLPIANNLEHKVYQYGEVIVSAGDEIDSFRIIASGQCKLLFGKIRSAPIDPNEGLDKRVISKNHFNTGIPDYTCKETASRDSNLALQGKDVKKSYEVWKNSKRQFNYDKLGVEGGYLKYLEHVSLATLGKGSFFGGRCLFNKEDFSKEEEALEQKILGFGNARVSVIANSSQVEIYELSKSKLELIPEFLAKLMKNGLKEVKEFDDVNVEKEIEKYDDLAKVREHEMKEFARTTGVDLFKKIRKVNE